MKPKKIDRTVALTGNPNVGKSTVFNALTGLHQHTGNWTGKTVETAVGFYENGEKRDQIIDLPGCYSLIPHSAEEEVARDFLCFEHYDRAVVVCDATKLSRGLALVLQVLEITPHVTVVLNLMDEAKRLRLELDTEKLADLLGVPVVSASAAKGKGLSDLLASFDRVEEHTPYQPQYREEIETALAMLCPYFSALSRDERKQRFFALRFLEQDETFLLALHAACPSFSTIDVENQTLKARAFLVEKGISEGVFSEEIASHIIETAEKFAKNVTKTAQKPLIFSPADRFLTSKRFGIPAMFLLLMLVFWITTVGANYPSEWLSSFFRFLESPLEQGLRALSFPDFLTELLVFGVYRTLSWIVSVMLPPMLIFFPLFTILEDVGYLPRIAFNLDSAFCRCGACGKQGLTMCMGLGCNAVGVTGARIIDSRRERLLAILTNVFVPCNGRFPALIAVTTVFFSGMFVSSSLVTALILALLIVFGVLMTFFVSWVLSRTLLRGTGSSFLLELPPYRRPQIGKILVRSFLDRTVFVLFRAVTVAVPAGFLIWIASHAELFGMPITTWISDFLDPLGKLMGLDGVILLAFLLGLPANEIVLPLCLMLYRADGMLSEIGSLEMLGQTLTSVGWTWQTALCFLIFTIFHTPCATTLLTIKKETGSWGYTALAFWIPTICGMGICVLFNLIFILI